MRTTTVLLLVLAALGATGALAYQAERERKPPVDKLTEYLGDAVVYFETSADEIRGKVKSEPCNWVILLDQVEAQEAMLSFADVFMHARESQWKDRFASAATRLKAVRAEVRAMRPCEH